MNTPQIRVENRSEHPITLHMNGEKAKYLREELESFARLDFADPAARPQDDEGNEVPNTTVLYVPEDIWNVYLEDPCVAGMLAQGELVALRAA